MTRRVVALAILGAVLAPAALAGQGRIVTDSVHSPGLADNVLGDPATRRVLVYLPPSYGQAVDRRYPVLYLLHGITSLPKEWLDGSYEGMDLGAALDSLSAAGTIPEFIVVMPDANNRLQADWYANSPVSGRWEDFIAKDLVAYVDGHYRTDRRRAARALVGHSMGGMGALAIGFDHPDVFGLVYAISPCCIGFTERLAKDSPTWPALSSLRRWQDAPVRLGTMVGLAAALDGDPASPRLYDELPFTVAADGAIVAHPDVQAKWLARMPPDLATAMVRRGDEPPVLFLEAGSEEPGILDGMRLVLDRLDALGVPYTKDVFTGGHVDQVRDRFTNHMLPAVGRWFASGTPRMDRDR